MYIATATTAITTLYFTHHAGGTYESDTLNQGEVEPIVELMTEGVLDPHNATGLYHGSEAVIDDTDAVNGGARGTPEFMTWWPVGTQANQDRMIPNFDTAQAYKVFPSILNGSFCLAIGPGATA